jgi:hypothetical protein
LKLTAFDLIFPGLLTLTLAVPGWTKSEAGTLAKSVVELTNDVVRAAPFQRTVEPLPKLAPVTVRVNAAPPWFALAGLSSLIPGTAMIVKVCAFEVIFPGLVTVTPAVPACTRSEAGTVAKSAVELTNAVLSAAPFQRTAEPLAKFSPVTVSVNDDPP